METLLKEIASNTRPKSSFQFIVKGNTTSFTTEFNPPINISQGRYELALVNLETYYSIPNIDTYNNALRYTFDGGNTWINVKIPEGSYDLKDINEALQLQMRQRNHFDRTNNHMFVTLSANDSTLRAVLEITNRQYQVDFNVNNSIRTVLGFNAKSYGSGYHESENIVNILSVNTILVEASCINGSFVNGVKKPIIYSFFPNAPPGYKIIETPINLVYLPVCSIDSLSDLKVTLTDQDGNILNLRGENVTIRFHMREI